MVSHYYAQKMTKRPNMPIFIDSGGFAGLFEGSAFKDYGDHASILTKEGDEIKPLEVLRFQEKNADLGATLDFIIPPKTELKEAQRRFDLTLKNAAYALAHLRQATSDTRHVARRLSPPDMSPVARRMSPPDMSPPDMSPLPTAGDGLFLYASLQCWDADSARHAAKTYLSMGFKGIALGGMVPHARDVDYLKAIVATVRKAAPKVFIHVFGIGNPDILPTLIKAGANSFDSSNYVRTAVGTRDKTSEHSGLHANLYAALNRLNKINSCFGAAFDLPSARIINL